jgi:ubiquinone/menaquinone biosynthesis C-methylase UbiE
MRLRRLLWALVVTFGGLLLFFFVGLKVQSRLQAAFGRRRACPPACAWVLERPGRVRNEVPAVLDRIGLRPGEHVLEVGCGPGVYTVEAARRLGPDGRLITVDLQPEMVSRTAQRVRNAGLANVETHIADAHHLPLEDGSVDLAFLVAVLPEIPDPQGALAEVRRVLRSHGVLSVSEGFLDPDYRFAFETLSQVQQAGFTLEERFGNVWQYTVNFRKAS